MSDISERMRLALPDQTQLEMLVGDILNEASTQGASAAEAAVSFDTGLSVTVRMGDVETLEHHRNRGLGVTVYFGKSKGSASTSDWTSSAVRETVRAACDIARHTASDPCAGLADSTLLATEAVDLDLYHSWALDAEQAINIATTCEASALAADTRIQNSEGASISSHDALRVYGNSNGFIGGYPTTRHSISCSVIGKDDRGMQRDQWYTVARDHAELESPEAVGARAAARAVRRLNSRRVGTRTAPVLFAPELARGLIGHFIGAIRGGSLYRKASFLVDHLGKAVFPEFVGIREEPHLCKALGSAPFDAEGVATHPRDLVRDGVLQGYVLDSYSARRLGMETTGNAGGVHNIIVATSDLGFEDLLKEMNQGLLVTQLMGQGINLLTGDYSRGAAGFWVDGGEMLYPVEEITIAGNLREMFRGLRAAGTDIDLRGGIRCGSLLVDRMVIAGE